MKSKILIAIAIVGAAISINSCDSEENAVPRVAVPVNCDTSKMTYSTGVGPIQVIVNTQCAVSGCHNYGSVNGDFTTYSGIQSAAQGGTSSQMYINLQGGATPMPNVPQPGWSTCDKLQIESWILAGAPQ